MRRFREIGPIRETILIGCFIFSIFLWVAARPALASTCIACHTDEAALEKNLSPVKEKKSAMTSGAG